MSLLRAVINVCAHGANGALIQGRPTCSNEFSIAACFALPLSAVAQEKMTEQQSKMGTCNKEAGDKKLEGDARKKFMSECLSASNKPTQQQKMTTCNKEAGDKKLAGDERKKFMSTACRRISRRSKRK